MSQQPDLVVATWSMPRHLVSTSYMLAWTCVISCRNADSVGSHAPGSLFLVDLGWDFCTLFTSSIMHFRATFRKMDKQRFLPDDVFLDRYFEGLIPADAIWPEGINDG